MKKLIFTLTTLFTINAMAQLSNGSTAPDFNVTDINGQPHNLYTYLNQGKTVFIDFSAAHCPTCWAYHGQHHLKDLYEQHGPNGLMSQDVMVIFIEFDANNGLNEIQGKSGNTQGDWTANTPYPIANPELVERSAIFNNFKVNYYPMIYAVCPDKKITLIGTKTSTQLYAHVGSNCKTTGISNSSNDNQIKLSVNPFEKSLSLTASVVKQAQLSVFDVSGKKVLEQCIQPNAATIDISNLNNGIYVYTLQVEGEGIVTRDKFILNY